MNGVADVEALLGTWTRGEPTFYDEFEPAHGNDGHTTADELAVELARYVDDNDDGVVYNGPELNASTVGAGGAPHVRQLRAAAGAGRAAAPVRVEEHAAEEHAAEGDEEASVKEETEVDGRSICSSNVPALPFRALPVRCVNPNSAGAKSS